VNCGDRTTNGETISCESCTVESENGEAVAGASGGRGRDGRRSGVTGFAWVRLGGSHDSICGMIV
jgi:hypothetical protein